MKQVSVDNLKENDILAFPILSHSGTVLIHADVALTEELIERAINLGVRTVYIKDEKDKDSFKLPEALGLDVYKIPDLEDSDKKIEELINNEYKTIIISNDVASFSEDIIKKYNKDNNVKIIISIDKDIL